MEWKARLGWLSRHRICADGLALVFLAAAPFIYFWKITLAQSVWYTPDIRQIYLPFGTELARALAEGRLPFWTPTIMAGFPLLAEGHVAALYPPYLLLYKFLPPEAALSYGMTLHLAWGALGMFLCARALGLPTASAVLAGFVFSFNGLEVEKVYYTPFLVASAWLPWLILFQTMFCRSRIGKRRVAGVWLILTSLAIAMQLLIGYPQMALLSLIAFTWISLSEEISGRVSRLDLGPISRVFPRALLWTLLPIVLGGGIAAVQLVPTAELIGYSVRSGPMGYEFVSSGSLPPKFLSELILPYSQSEPDEHTNGNIAYFGLVPLFLAVVGTVLRRDPRTISYALLAVVALSLAFGDLNPLFHILAELPIISFFRTPARYLFIFLFASILLSGIGLEELSARLHRARTAAQRSRQSLLAFVLVVALFSLMIAGVMWFAQEGSLEDWLAAWRVLPLFLTGAIAGVLLLAWKRKIGPNVFALALVGLAVLDLASFAPPLLFKHEELQSPAYVESRPRSLPVVEAGADGSRILTDMGVVPTVAAFRASLYPNTAMVFGLESAQANSPLVFARHSAYLANLSPAMVNLLGVRYWLVPLEPRFIDRTVLPPAALGQDIVEESLPIPSMAVSAIEVRSFTEQSSNLAEGTIVGRVVLTLDDGRQDQIPIRVGIETADWDYDRKRADGSNAYERPTVAHTFPAFWRSYGKPFEGHTYNAHFGLEKGISVAGILVQVLEPSVHLTVERITLYDGKGAALSLAQLTGRNDYELAYLSDTVAIWENSRALPRALVLHEAQVTSDNAALERLRKPDFPADRVVILNEGKPMSGADSVGTDRVEITKYEAQNVRLAVHTDRPGYLLLADSWYPGWVATVDGRDTPISRADLIFRAVEIEPGDHNVTFEYRPVSFLWGAAISAVSLLVSGGIAIFAFLRYGGTVS